MAKIRMRKFVPKRERINFQGQTKNPAAALKAKLRTTIKKAKGSAESKPRRKFAIRNNESPPWPELEEQFIIPAGPRASKWWDLFKDGINNSGLAMWLENRHTFYLRYVCGYDREQYAEPIEFGNVFHWLIEQWHKNPAKMKKPFHRLVEDYHPEFMERAPTLSPKQKEVQSSFYGMAAAMWPFYADKYADDLKKSSRHVEREFRAPHKLADGTTIRLYGTVDLEWAGTRGGVDIIDHKTTSFINDDERRAMIQLDLQLMLYSWARFQETGVVTETIIHDVIRKSTLRMGGKESPQTYGQRIAGKVAADPGYFFVRYPAAVGRRKLKLYSQTIITPIIEDFAAWARGETPHYVNPNTLIGRYGPSKFFGPITQGNFGGLPRKRPTTRGVEI